MSLVDSSHPSQAKTRRASGGAVAPIRESVEQNSRDELCREVERHLRAASIRPFERPSADIEPPPSTAAVLAVGGVALLLNSAPGLALVAPGMLLYAVIADPGYFLARRENPRVVMFALLTAATVTAIVMTPAL